MAATVAALLKKYWNLLDQRRDLELAGQPTDTITAQIIETAGILFDKGMNKEKP